MGHSGPVCPSHPFTAGAQARLPSVCLNAREGPRAAALFPPMVNAPFLSHVLQCPWPPSRHSVPRVLPHVSLLTEQRRNRNEPRVPSPTSPRSEQGEASQCKRGNLIVVTSEVWALAQDSNQPETHKDQSTSECYPGPQAKPVGQFGGGKQRFTHSPHCQPKAGVGLTQPRIWPGHPSTSGARRPLPSLCVS